MDMIGKGVDEKDPDETAICFDIIAPCFQDGRASEILGGKPVPFQLSYGKTGSTDLVCEGRAGMEMEHSVDKGELVSNSAG